MVLRAPAETVSHIVSVPDRLDIGLTEAGNLAAAPTRRDLLYLLTGRTVTELEPSVLAALASLDGATVTDPLGNLIAVGAILRHPYTESLRDDAIVEGARTTAAMSASRFGPVLKVSEDGGIAFFDGQKILGDLTTRPTQPDAHFARCPVDKCTSGERDDHRAAARIWTPPGGQASS